MPTTDELYQDLAAAFKERDHWEKQSHALKEENDNLGNRIKVLESNQVNMTSYIERLENERQVVISELEEIRNAIGDTPMKTAGHEAVTYITRVVSKFKRPTPAEDDPSDGA